MFLRINATKCLQRLDKNKCVTQKSYKIDTIQFAMTICLRYYYCLLRQQEKGLLNYFR